MTEVVEDVGRGVVVIGGHEVEGHLAETFCEHCGRPKIYYDRFDAYFCAGCNVWLESNCSDPACFYCRERPPTPLP